MPLLISRIKCDASGANEIVIHSVGPDGMETNRDILSPTEAERLILSILRAINSSRPETVNVGHRPSHGTAILRSQGGSSKIDISEPDPDMVCRICDDNDHCLPRWEDDGGGTARPRPPVLVWVEDPESNSAGPRACARSSCTPCTGSSASRPCGGSSPRPPTGHWTGSGTRPTSWSSGLA